MPGRGNIRFLHSPSGAIKIVASAKATSPPSQGSDSGLTIVIPIPSETQNGDNLIVVTQHLPGRSISAPSGWTSLGGSGSQAFRIWRRIASSEPASYSWTQSGTSNTRSGCIVVVRSGTIGALAVNAGVATDPVTIPDRTAGPIPGALWLAFYGGDDAQNDEDLGVSGFTLLVQHSGNGPQAYHVARATGIGFIASLSANETVTGNTFSEINALGRSAAALIIDPS